MTDLVASDDEEMVKLSISQTNGHNNNNNVSARLPNIWARSRSELSQFSWRGHFLEGACYNWRHPASSFNVQDPGTDRTIDICASFAPTGLLVILWKTIATFWVFTCVVYGLYNDYRYYTIGTYFVYFSNWATDISFAYIICSLVNSVVATKRERCIDQKSSSSSSSSSSQHQLLGPSRNSRMIRWTWFFFVLAAHTELGMMLVFWNFVFRVDPSHPAYRKPTLELILDNYQDFVTHFVVGFLILIDGLVVNRIPVRLSHYWQVTMWWYLPYSFWMTIYPFLSDDPVFYWKFMTMNFKGKLAPPTQESASPRLIYAAVILHVLTGLLILCYGFAFNRRIPARVAKLGTLVLCGDVFYLVWPGIYPLVGRSLESFLGPVVPLVLVLTTLSPLFHLILYGISLLSCCAWSGQNRRYLPVEDDVAAIVTDDDDNPKNSSSDRDDTTKKLLDDVDF